MPGAYGDGFFCNNNWPLIRCDRRYERGEVHTQSVMKTKNIRHFELIFETVAEAQTSVDPTKLTRAVEKFAAETRREIDFGFARVSYACALCAAHYANRLVRLQPAV